jgi:hypothetical protein
MWEDPIVLEIRRIREELAAQFDFDVGAIFEDMRKRQATQMATPDRRSAPLHPGR